MTTQYRKARIQDKDALKRLALVAYGTYEHVLAQPDWQDLHSKLTAEEAYTHLLEIATCFVAYLEEKIIGVAYLVPRGNPTDIFDADCCYLRMVGVHPDYQGKGIGRQLTRLCIAYATQAGEHTMSLHTSEFMDAARHLYESLGFVRVKNLPPLFGKQYGLYQLKLSKE